MVVAKRISGSRIKLIWTREDDVRGGYHSPLFAHRVEIRIGKDGMPPVAGCPGSATREERLAQQSLAGQAAGIGSPEYYGTAVACAADVSIETSARESTA